MLPGFLRRYDKAVAGRSLFRAFVDVLFPEAVGVGVCPLHAAEYTTGVAKITLVRRLAPASQGAWRRSATAPRGRVGEETRLLLFGVALGIFGVPSPDVVLRHLLDALVRTQPSHFNNYQTSPLRLVHTR